MDIQNKRIPDGEFDLLRKEFARLNKKNLVLRDLEEIIKQKLKIMVIFLQCFPVFSFYMKDRDADF